MNLLFFILLSQEMGYQYHTTFLNISRKKQLSDFETLIKKRLKKRKRFL